MYGPNDYWIWRQRRRELLREVELNRLAKETRSGRKKLPARSSRAQRVTTIPRLALQPPPRPAIQDLETTGGPP